MDTIYDLVGDAAISKVRFEANAEILFTDNFQFIGVGIDPGIGLGVGLGGTRTSVFGTDTIFSPNDCTN